MIIFNETNCTSFGPGMAEAVLHLKPGTIYITGHSPDGATAHLGALGLHLMTEQIPKYGTPAIKVCSFAAPRVCNAHFPPHKLWQRFTSRHA